MRQDSSSQRLSDAIGTIYDAAIDPALWTRALEQMCGLVDSFFGSLSVIDRAATSVRFLARWGGDPYWLDLLDRKYATMMPFIPVLDRFEVGQPFSMPMAADLLGEPDVWNGPFVTEWATPAGVRDTVAAILQRSNHRLASLSLSTGTNRELVTDAELATVALLAPHVRRALTISDLIDMKSLAADTFERMLDTLQVGVIAVDSRARICHANQVAQGMLSVGGPLSSRERRVVVAGSPARTRLLHEAIALAGEDEAMLGGSGSGVPLRFADGRPAVGHVLPLRHGSLRRGVGLGAAAAIFVATPTDAQHAPIDALAALYELTDAETRVLGQIADGKNRGQAAISLSIADSTVKSHLDRIFSKTGTSNQHELTRLLSNLSAPVMTA